MEFLNEKLRIAGVQLNPSATQEDLERLESGLGMALPSKIRALYLNHNGEVESLDPPWLYRLLSVDEVLELWRQINGELGYFDPVPELKGKFLPFWDDDNSNNLVWYLEGPLEGLIGEADHEQPYSIKPVFASLERLYDAMLEGYTQNVIGWTEDFPEIKSDENSSVRFDYCLEHYLSSTIQEMKEYYGTALIQLCPVDRTSELIPLLKIEDDRSLRGGICQLLGLRQVNEAVPVLTDMIKVEAFGIYINIPLDALGVMGSSSSRAALLDIAQTAFIGDLSHVVRALEKHGYLSEVVLQNNRIEGYRIAAPETPSHWLELVGIPNPPPPPREKR